MYVVVQCLNGCQAYQAVQRNKKLKLKCKVCGKISPIRAPYAQADDPSVLRPIVAALNASRGATSCLNEAQGSVHYTQSSDKPVDAHSASAHTDPWAALDGDVAASGSVPTIKSKWIEYATSDDTDTCTASTSLHWFEREDPYAAHASNKWRFQDK